MSAVRTRFVLGCLLACVLVAPAFAGDATPTPQEEAYGALKQRLVQQVEDGRMTPVAMERFLEKLQDNAQTIAEIRVKDADAANLQIRSLFREAEVTGTESDREDLLKAVTTWVDVRESSEASPLRRSRELRRQ